MAFLPFLATSAVWGPLIGAEMLPFLVYYSLAISANYKIICEEKRLALLQPCNQTLNHPMRWTGHARRFWSGKPFPNSIFAGFSFSCLATHVSRQRKLWMVSVLELVVPSPFDPAYSPADRTQAVLHDPSDVMNTVQ
jgi:hypothetical protein